MIKTIRIYLICRRAKKYMCVDLYDAFLDCIKCQTDIKLIKLTLIKYLKYNQALMFYATKKAMSIRYKAAKEILAKHSKS